MEKHNFKQDAICHVSDWLQLGNWTIESSFSNKDGLFSCVPDPIPALLLQDMAQISVFSFSLFITLGLFFAVTVVGFF